LLPLAAPTKAVSNSVHQRPPHLLLYLMSRTVLILEDSRTQANLIGRMFERVDFTPSFVLDRSAALAQLQDQTWSLLLLDVYIAGENTLNHLEEFRALAPSTPIAIMTAVQRDNPLATSNALNTARRAGVQFLLPKPFSFDDILQICGAVVQLEGPDTVFL